MLNKLQSLKLTQKLALISALLAIPTMVLLYFYWSARQVKIATAKHELVGTEFFPPVKRVIEGLGQHRGATFTVLSGGDSQFRARQADVRTKVDTAMQGVDDVITRGKDSLNVNREWSDLKTKWSILKNQSGNAGENFAQHSQLISEMIDFLRLVSDRSELTLDPNIDTYYLWNNLMEGLVPWAEYTSQVRDTGSGVVVRGTVRPEDVIRVQYLTSQVQQVTRTVVRNYGKIVENNPSLRPSLEAPFNETERAAGSFLMSTQRDLGRAGETTLDPGTAFERGTTAIDAAFRLFDASHAALGARLQEYVKDLSREQYTQLAFTIFLMSLGVGLVYLISNAVARQADSLNRLFSAIGLGDFSARAEVTAQDELGTIAASMNAILENQSNLLQSREERDQIQSSIMKLLDEVSGVAQGDLTKEAEVTADVTGAIADSFNYMIAELRQVISRVQRTTAQVTTSTSEMQRTASELASGSQAQSQQVMQASAVITDMLQSIQQVSRSAQEATRVASHALDSARTGSETVNKTISGMNQIRTQVQETSKRIKRLGESSQEIGEIVQLIGDIADRTSILALNASIQAAMAGEAGRGFAVVAEEVERLAERATESTKKIAALIKSVQSDTTEAIAAMEETTREVVGGSQLANEAGQRLSEIEKVSRQISELVQAISAASKDQAQGSEAVSRNVTGISEFTRQTAEGASVAEQSIRHLSRLANELDESLRRFRLPNAA